MKKMFLTLFVFSLVIQLADAQLPRPRRNVPSASEPELWKMRRYEIIAGLGSTQFFGDIGGYSIGKNALGFKDITLKHTRFNLTAAITYKVTSRISARLNLAGGTFHATDIKGSNEKRGFESFTTFFEPSLLGEYYFVRSKGESSYTFLKGKRVVLLPLPSTINVYGFTGVGGIAYSVKYDIPLVLTGTTKDGGFAAVIPAGIGVSMAYSGKINFGVELGGRYAFSDYLDGYTSVFSKATDVYYFLTLKVSLKLPTSGSGLPGFRNIFP
ncbi:MAG: hypothetical protein ACUVTX_08630 [Bacteroidales bacterium]